MVNPHAPKRWACKRRLTVMTSRHGTARLGARTARTPQLIDPGSLYGAFWAGLASCRLQRSLTSLWNQYHVVSGGSPRKNIRHESPLGIWAIDLCIPSGEQHAVPLGRPSSPKASTCRPTSPHLIASTTTGFPRSDCLYFNLGQGWFPLEEGYYSPWRVEVAAEEWRMTSNWSRWQLCSATAEISRRESLIDQIVLM